MPEDDDYWELVEDADHELAALRHADEPDEAAIAQALVGKADSLGRLGRIDDAARCIDEVLDRFGDQAALSQVVTWAIGTEATFLRRAGRRKEADVLYAELDQRMGHTDPSATPPELRVELASAKAYAADGKIEEAFMTAVGVATLFAFDTASPDYAEIAAESVLLCADWGRVVDEVAAFDSYHEIVRRFGSDQTPGVQQVVTAAQQRLDEAAS